MLSGYEQSLTMAYEIHPPIWQARLVRSLRFIRHVRGWGRISAMLLPAKMQGAFEVRNARHTFAGNLNSFLDREIYLMGGYEEDEIIAFLDLIPPHRRRIILDIGANVGTHSIAFADVFRQVHAFEPNPKLWPAFEKNVATNWLKNVTLHKAGLGDARGTLPFYSIAKDNYGLGTVLPVEQYDLPLQQIGEVQVEVGDELVERDIGLPIDAIKVDVQGFEPQVLKGLERTLRRDQPMLWVEVGKGTISAGSPLRWLKELVGGPVDIFRFREEQWGPFLRTALQQVGGDDSGYGNYVVVPR